MTDKEFLKKSKKYAEPFCITNGGKFKLKQIDPEETLGLETEDKAEAKDMLERGVELLSKLQDELYAHDRWAILLIFQAMDAAGKDGAIKHVLPEVNPKAGKLPWLKPP